MLFCTGIKKKIAAIFALFFLLHGPQAKSEEFTQAGAQNTAAKLNNRGSDDSMEAATNSAMVAVMNLAALNIPGAFSNGYRAYGQYINSEKLDDLEAKTTRRKGSMASVGSGMVGSGNSSTGSSGNTGGGISGTTFSRLDPSFLYRGETSEVAAEFEKRSGMKREEFLRHLGSATDSDITFQDPNLQQKLEGRFDMFKAGIQNKEFKDGLEKAASMFSPTMRGEAIAKLQSFYNEQWGGSPPESIATNPVAESSQLAVANPAPSSNPAFPETATKAKVDEEKISRSPASTPNQNGKNSMFIGINSGNPQETINELLSSPSSIDSDSIFHKVSKKYRSLTPRMIGSAPTSPMKF
jgi:hypothetical protein